MSDAFWLGMFTFLAAVLAAAQSWRNGQKAQTVIAKTEEVHQLVNSQKTALVAEVANLKAEVACFKAAVLSDKPK